MKRQPLLCLLVTMLIALAPAGSRAALLLHSSMDNAHISGTTVSNTAPGATILGSASGTVVSVSGLIQQARGFTSTNDGNYISYGNNFNLSTNSHTISVWFRWDANSPTNLSRFIADDGNENSNADGWSISHKGSNLMLRAAWTNDDNQSTNKLGLSRVETVTADAWHHVVMVFDQSAGRFKGYYDGLISSTDAAHDTIINGWTMGGGGGTTNVFPTGGKSFTSTSNLVVGQIATLGAAYKGGVDDFAIWNQTLTYTEVKSLYNLATNTALSYNAVQAQQLWSIFASGTSDTVGGSTWAKVSDGSLAGAAGDVLALGDGRYGLVLDAASNGVAMAAFSPPTVSTLGTTNVTATHAEMRGSLGALGSDPQAWVYVYWGRNDGGDVALGNWAKTNFVGLYTSTAAAIATNMALDLGLGDYWYRFAATNAVADSWGQGASSYLVNTGLWVVATSDAHEDGTVGTFTVFRASSATGEALRVYYQVGGTATSVTDYMALSGYVDMAAGVSQAVVNVTAVMDSVQENPAETVVLTLSPRNYPVGSPESATLSIGEIVQFLPNPPDFASLGSLSLVSGNSVTFNTDTLTIAGDFTGSGAIWTNAAGRVAPAVFAFNSIDLPNGVNVSIVGDRAILLLSRGDITVGTTLSVNGGAATSGAVGSGGPGAVSNNVVNTPPPANGGNGGTYGNPGVGLGRGGGASVQTAGGGGAGYGGSGGAGQQSAPGVAGSAGFTYGDAGLVDLYGGSGGGGGKNNADAGSGGGGGGALGMVALGNITLESTSSLSAVGGSGYAQPTWWCAGGGGSGGAILLAGKQVNLQGAGARVTVKGGSGADANVDGGGGGGGRVAVYSTNDWAGAAGKDKQETAPSVVDVSAGSGNGSPSAGTFYDGSYPEYLVPVATPPALTTQSATNVTAASAFMNSDLTTLGSDTQAWVYVFWGDSNGGDVASGDWSRTNFVGYYTNATTGISTNMALDLGLGDYWYRFAATNALADSWGQGASSYLVNTGLWVVATSDAHEDGTVGTFTVFRASSATGEALRVYYQVGGTATSVTDYMALSGYVDMAAGVSQAVVNVTAVIDSVQESPVETVVLTLSPRNYPVGSPESATLSIGESVRFLPDPRKFASLGSLSLVSGNSVTFDTDALTIAGNFTGSGAIWTNAAGRVAPAVFAFNSIDLPSGVNVSIVGDRAILFLSRGDITVGTTLSVNGGSATSGAVGSGGPGAVGNNVVNTPPPANGGNGGTYGNPGVGLGRGGGGLPTNSKACGGGGAGYGGVGSAGQTWAGGGAGSAGVTYGDAGLVDLFGGSGGGGGKNDADAGSGGGGGGALGMVALGTITIESTALLCATGGVGYSSGQWIAGGGGSGGAILLAGEQVDLQGAGARVTVKGGSGADGASVDGGGGGGGRVAFYAYHTDFIGAVGKDQQETAPSGVDVSAGWGNGSPSAGTFYDGRYPEYLVTKGTVFSFH